MSHERYPSDYPLQQPFVPAESAMPAFKPVDLNQLRYAGQRALHHSFEQQLDAQNEQLSDEDASVELGARRLNQANRIGARALDGVVDTTGSVGDNIGDFMQTVAGVLSPVETAPSALPRHQRVAVTAPVAGRYALAA